VASDDEASTVNGAKLRVAWVVPRYGPEIGGGAEELCRRAAESLVDELDSTVLTTCALDLGTWANHFPAGVVEINGVTVRRFPVASGRHPGFEQLSAEMYARPDDVAQARRWLDAQGPDAPWLLEHLVEHGGEYDAVCFLPYLYTPTVEGLRAVHERALLAPCAHDEPPLSLAVFDPVFASPRVLVFNTPEEQALVEERFGTDPRPRFVIGVGVYEPPPADSARFRAAFDIDGPYILYVGRVDPGKGVLELAELVERVRARHPQLSLVLLGRPVGAVPDLPRTVVTGFVDEQTKHDAIAGAVALAVPSRHESLSIAALEAWSHGRPTLVNARSPVLVGQSVRAGGGLWYETPEEFEAALRLFLERPEIADSVGAQGRRWALAANEPDRVRELWLAAIRAAAAPPRRPARRSPHAMSPQEARGFLESSTFVWHQRFELAEGVWTPGLNDIERLFEISGISDDLAGVSVLDIGTSNGAAAFMAERRGAERVVAVDAMPIEYFGFDRLRDFLGSRVEYVQTDVYDLAATLGECFDIVVFWGVLYHLRHPLVALDNVRAVANGPVFLETEIADGTIEDGLARLPFVRFEEGDALGGDPSNWFVPTLSALLAWCRSSGLEPTVLDAWPDRDRPRRCMVRARVSRDNPPFVDATPEVAVRALPLERASARER
jgi:glycosyltransferase involved in cell wall biosynthesis/2-polyprenyl-3-methyl-5-hydroxy-6-metoxy-1,4-benzoquinol methylase